jgi:hypothetical protein
MARLGFDRRTGLIYEGMDGPTHPVWPTPALSQATLIEKPEDLERIPGDFDGLGWTFIDGSFDPGSRVRRGRLFQKFGAVSWERTQVEAHPAINSDLQKATINGGHVSKELSVYYECTELLQKPNRGEGLQLALGRKDGHSLWRILQTERIASGDVLVTLRAESAFGVIPQLDANQIATDALPGVQAALDRVVNSAYRELPQSVVDHCRNAAVMLTSRWMQKVTHAAKPTERDLGYWINEVRRQFGDGERVALRSALETINRLHPRGKDNELYKYSMRQVDEHDAEYAVHALSFLIREVNWG